MKFTVSFDFDVSHHPALNVGTVADLAGSLQNLSSLINRLHLSTLQSVHHLMADVELEPELRKAAIASLQNNVRVTEQLFNNYRVQGTTEDGHTFDFTHKEPGYEEKTLIDGVEVND